MDLLVEVALGALIFIILFGLGFWLSVGFWLGLARAREPEIRVTPMPPLRAFWTRFQWSTFPLGVAWFLVMALFSFAVGMGTDVEWGYYPPRVVALRALDFFGLMMTPLLLYLAGCIVLAPRLTNPFLLTLVLVPVTGFLSWGMIEFTDSWNRSLTVDLAGAEETFHVHIGFIPVGAVSLLSFAAALLWAWRQGRGWFRLPD